MQKYHVPPALSRRSKTRILSKYFSAANAAAVTAPVCTVSTNIKYEAGVCVLPAAPAPTIATVLIRSWTTILIDLIRSKICYFSKALRSIYHEIPLSIISMRIGQLVISPLHAVICFRITCIGLPCNVVADESSPFERRKQWGLMYVAACLCAVLSR